MTVSWIKRGAGAALGLAMVTAVGLSSAQASFITVDSGNLTYTLDVGSCDSATGVTDCSKLELHAAGSNGVLITGENGGALVVNDDVSFLLYVQANSGDLTSWVSELIGGTNGASAGEEVTGFFGGSLGSIIVDTTTPRGGIAFASEFFLTIDKDLKAFGGRIASLYQGPTLVPEPMSATLLGFGLAGLAALRRRRRAA